MRRQFLMLLACVFAFGALTSIPAVNYVNAADEKVPVKCKKCAKIEYLIRVTEKELASVDRRIDSLTSSIAAIQPTSEKAKINLQKLIDIRKRYLDQRADLRKEINDLEKKLRQCQKTCLK